MSYPFAACQFLLNSREMAAGRDKVGRQCGKPTTNGVACAEHEGKVTWQDHTDPRNPGPIRGLVEKPRTWYATSSA